MSPVCHPTCSGTGRAALVILLLSGLCSCRYHYDFVREPKNWGEAQRYCREKFADLALPNNREDMNRLIAAAKESRYAGQAWIGLHDKCNWVWSMARNGVPGEQNWKYRKWAKDAPNHTRRQKTLCVSFYGGSWSDQNCNSNLSFVCYDNSTELGLPAISAGRYFFINQNETWSRAENYCRTHHTGLTSVRNKSDNTLLHHVIPQGQTAWIGLTRNTWTQCLSHKLNFTYWLEGRPLIKTGRCAASLFDSTNKGRWKENGCATRLHFVCQSKKKTLFSIKLTTLKSTIDLNNPNVMEAIVNQMKTNITDEEVKKNVIFTWIKNPGKNIFHKKEDGP
ncbi:macrophage mannose receptor 1 isoform X2 [Echeneis naucrates]|uniref:Macrophage mannose receptor 1-like n=1 Tax=Echeneis naucrates TaxID=173247 RepID=A0A665V7D7_ECHNA|nr:macrophage mannose receptor 1-like isoform X2 [Echeneis naucrates]